MASTVPHRFLFRYSFPVRRVAKLPGKNIELPPKCTLPDLGELDNATPFAEMRLAWNDAGIAVTAKVRGRQHPPVSRLLNPTEADCVQVWIDTRNTQSIHRASRYCHHFCALPNTGDAGDSLPAVVQLPIARARDDAAIAASEQFGVATELLDDGYRLGLWLPAEVLNGFDPEASPRLGFYYQIRDSELGEQFLTVGPEFPFAHDPSLWCTLELVDQT